MVIYLYSGGNDGFSTRNDILEYDPETKMWKPTGAMKEAREDHAVSVVDYGDYADFCR